VPVRHRTLGKDKDTVKQILTHSRLNIFTAGDFSINLTGTFQTPAPCRASMASGRCGCGLWIGGCGGHHHNSLVAGGTKRQSWRRRPMPPPRRGVIGLTLPCGTGMARPTGSVWFSTARGGRARRCARFTVDARNWQASDHMWCALSQKRAEDPGRICATGAGDRKPTR